jgi:hypothetical protein
MQVGTWVGTGGGGVEEAEELYGEGEDEGGVLL